MIYEPFFRTNLPMQQHIILIEDDQDISEITCLILESAGYRTTRFGAFTSLEELTALHADCFLLDENLPGMSGHIISILLKSRASTKNIPVIIFSAGTGLQRAVDLGEAQAGIAKPFELDHFLLTVSQVLA